MNDEKKPLLTVPDEKNDIPVIEAVGEQPAEYENKPWQWKLLALVCSCLLSVGSHFAAHMLSSLKSTLIEVFFFFSFKNQNQISRFPFTNKIKY